MPWSNPAPRASRTPATPDCLSKAVSIWRTTPPTLWHSRPLRHRGYRSESRYLVFQALAHTLGFPSETWRVLAKAHERRNLAEYEGMFDVDERLLEDVIAAAQAVSKAVKGLAAPEAPETKK